MTMYRRTFIFVAVSAGLASSLSLIGGIGLEFIAERLAPLIPLLIALPSLNNLVGDYASIIAAHTGDPAERRISKRKLAVAIYKVLVVNIEFIVLLSSVIAFLRGYVFSWQFFTEFLLFVSFAAIASVLLMFLLSHVIDIVLRKQRINPDELLIPIVTSLADIFMLVMVTMAALTLFA